MYYGIDALAPFTSVAPVLHEHGLSFVMRYLKNLTRAEITALHAHTISLGLIFELGTNNALAGRVQGKWDGALARKQALDLGAPAGGTVFATVDRDIASEHQLNVVGEYLVAFGAALGEYKLGVYACGSVLRQLTGSAVLWLAGAAKWSGSSGFSGWHLKQGPTFSGGTWEGVRWPNLGMAYDPNLAVDLSWAWSPQDGVQPPAPTDPVLRVGAQGEAVARVQAALNRHPLKVDGVFGVATEHAVAAFQAAHRLRPDGIVGPETWAALGGQEIAC
jgi:hypothetical protein